MTPCAASITGYQGLFTRLASLARSLTSPASAGLLRAGVAWLALSGALALPATAQAQTDVLVSNLDKDVTDAAILNDRYLRAQAFSVPSGGGDNAGPPITDYTVEATSGTGERVKTATQTITVTVTDAGGEAPGKPAAPACRRRRRPA